MAVDPSKFAITAIIYVTDEKISVIICAYGMNFRSLSVVVARMFTNSFSVERICGKVITGHIVLDS
jgi:hypothetical protein